MMEERKQNEKLVKVEMREELVDEYEQWQDQLEQKEKQLDEHLVHTQGVVGSNPTAATISTARWSSG